MNSMGHYRSQKLSAGQSRIWLFTVQQWLINGVTLPGTHRYGHSCHHRHGRDRPSTWRLSGLMISDPNAGFYGLYVAHNVHKKEEDFFFSMKLTALTINVVKSSNDWLGGVAQSAEHMYLCVSLNYYLKQYSHPSLTITAHFPPTFSGMTQIFLTWVRF